MNFNDEHFLISYVEYQDWFLSQLLLVTTSQYPDTPPPAALLEHHLDAADGKKLLLCSIKLASFTYTVELI